MGKNNFIPSFRTETREQQMMKATDHLCRGHDFRIKAFCKHNPSVKQACEHLDNCLLAQDIAECLRLSEIGLFHNLKERTAIIFMISSIFVVFYTENT